MRQPLPDRSRIGDGRERIEDIRDLPGTIRDRAGEVRDPTRNRPDRHNGQTGRERAPEERDFLDRDRNVVDRNRDRDRDREQDWDRDRDRDWERDGDRRWSRDRWWFRHPQFGWWYWRWYPEYARYYRWSPDRGTWGAAYYGQGVPQEKYYESDYHGGRAALGVRLADAREGALVTSVVPGSPAHRAGIREGDILLSIDGQPVDNPQSVVRTVESRAPGEVVRLEILADGRVFEVTVPLAYESRVF